MSNATTIRDTLRTLIPTITGFTDKTEIYNVYDLLDNPDHNLRDGWGLKIGSATNSSIDYNCTYGEAREFIVVITSELKRADNDRAPIDTIENAMMTDLDSLKRSLLDASQIGIDASVGKIDYVGDTGIIRYNEKETFKLMSIEVTFNIESFEDL